LFVFCIFIENYFKNMNGLDNDYNQRLALHAQLLDQNLRAQMDEPDGSFTGDDQLEQEYD